MAHNAVSCEIWYEAYMNNELEGSEAKWSSFDTEAQTNSCPGLKIKLETSVSTEKTTLGSEPYISQTRTRHSLPALLFVRIGCEQ
jgi:hypothetical protein